MISAFSIIASSLAALSSSSAEVVGNSGSGKTILCSHFLYHGLTAQEENGLYISFSESKAQFYANLKTLGMDFDKFEDSPSLHFWILLH